MAHLVVKRGHHGRYRFMMIGDGEKIGGEVQVEAVDHGPAGSRALALAKIARLAEALLALVTTEGSAGAGVDGGRRDGKV